MSQYDHIRNIARYGLENDREKLMTAVNELIDYSRKTNKTHFALQLQSLLREADLRPSVKSLTKVGSDTYFNRLEDKEFGELILEKFHSEYHFDNMVATKSIKTDLQLFIREHQAAELLSRHKLPVSNKVLFHGPSGCGKTLAAYVLAGELKKTLLVVNLGAVVSSKLGETSKNLSKIFRKATQENCIIFLDEFDSLGKVRDYSQDHGEMKRVVNTILQLFDYLSPSSIVIAATNQKNMLDEALVRRFDLNLQFSRPSPSQIKELISLVLTDTGFSFDKPNSLSLIITAAKGLSFYSIQKTLVTAIKRSLFDNADKIGNVGVKISTAVWKELVLAEKKAIL